MRRLRPYLIALVLCAAAVGAFIGIVAPLFMGGHSKPTAEVTGLFDTQLKSDTSQQLAVGVDNTGDTIISPLCLKVEFSRPVTLQRALFDNTDPHTFSNGRTCGGDLVGQETINVIIVAIPQSPGPLTVRVTPYAGNTAIGNPLVMNVSVS